MKFSTLSAACRVEIMTCCVGVSQAGEFQCYDDRALASLAEAAAAVQEPEWGLEGPHDAGEYNSWPEVSPWRPMKAFDQLWYTVLSSFTNYELHLNTQG